MYQIPIRKKQKPQQFQGEPGDFSEHNFRNFLMETDLGTKIQEYILKQNKIGKKEFDAQCEAKKNEFK